MDSQTATVTVSLPNNAQNRKMVETAKQIAERPFQRKVYIVQHKRLLLIMGVFDSPQKAQKYIDERPSVFAIIEAEVI